MYRQVWTWVARWLRRRRAKRAADELVARAAALASEGGSLEAAHLYAAALALLPKEPELHAACGEALETGGDLQGARSHYRESLRLDAASRAAAGLSRVEAKLKDGQAAGARQEVGLDALVPELAPGTAERRSSPRRDFVHLARLGRSERSHRGMQPTLRGVVAVRGFCITEADLGSVAISLDGERICLEPLQGRAAAEHQARPRSVRKFVFNLWLDLSARQPGSYELEVRLLGARGERLTRRERIVIAPPLDEADLPGSDALVSPPQAKSTSVDEAVNARESVIRPGSRALIGEQLARVLVIRADQLGDFVCSIAAMLRLRDAFPGARLTALVQSHNEQLCRSLGIFDEVLTFEFGFDPSEGRRILPIGKQRELAAQLHLRQFDLAIDLSDNSESRPLLILSGAKRTAGFGAHAFPWLSIGIDTAVPDPVNGLECIPYSAKKLAFAEWLAALTKSSMPVRRRDDLDPTRLGEFGLSGRRYALLHTGARLEFSRWPHFSELARLLANETDLSIAVLVNSEQEAAAFQAQLPASERFTILPGPLEFELFDTLLSFCAVFVGNDSGPKHLATLRGVPVVSLHMARVNWSQWGQAERGVIVSRKVPCAGCGIHDHPEECGRDFVCLTGIRPDEVLSAVRLALEQGAESGGA